MMTKNFNKNQSPKRVDPLEEVINLMLRQQAKTCVRAKKILDEKAKEAAPQ